MNLVVDTNIIISLLITPSGTIADIVFNKLDKFVLISPRFMFDELLGKSEKIRKITGYSTKDLRELFYIIRENIEFIDDELITFENQKKALQLIHDIDKKDLLFLALSIQTGYPLWTGDLKLRKGLKKKGHTNIVDTNELIILLEKRRQY
ncbi:MAG: PIN domain-containing protein [Chlorobi bacterium]|nr:PIN domain-containing protein [Chlorobiota bacterium]